MIYGMFVYQQIIRIQSCNVLHLSQLAVSEFMKNMPVAEQLIALC